MADRDKVIKAIKRFSWDNYGLDEVDPKSRYAEWVPDLADKICAALDLQVILNRLVAAERVCVLVGINAPDRQTDRGKALTQGWMDWQHLYGLQAAGVTDEEIAEYARRRDGITEATLARIREDRAAADESAPGVSE